MRCILQKRVPHVVYSELKLVPGLFVLLVADGHCEFLDESANGVHVLAELERELVVVCKRGGACSEAGKLEGGDVVNSAPGGLHGLVQHFSASDIGVPKRQEGASGMSRACVLSNFRQHCQQPALLLSALHLLFSSSSMTSPSGKWDARCVFSLPHPLYPLLTLL